MIWRRRTEGPPPAPAACWSCRWPPNHELQNSEQALRNLDISLIAGVVKCDEDVIGEAPLVCEPGMHRCPLLVSLRPSFRRARLSQLAYRAPGGGTPASRFECNGGMLLHDYRVATVAASGSVTTNANRRAYTVCAPAWKTRLASARGRRHSRLREAASRARDRQLRA
jgi:hypothetical protein